MYLMYVVSRGDLPLSSMRDAGQCEGMVSGNWCPGNESSPWLVSVVSSGPTTSLIII